MELCESCARRLDGQNGRVCNQCEGAYCLEHIENHHCRPRVFGLEVPAWPGSEGEEEPGGSGGSNLVAGAILIATGAVISLTGLGLLIGVPLGMLGFVVMFPRFSVVMVLLALGVLVYLL